MRPLSLIPLMLALPGCLSSAPLEGDWSGQMTVSFLDDTRTFTIEITELDLPPSCVDQPDADDCITPGWEGPWDLYSGTATYGGDADLSGPFNLNHCVGDGCIAGEVPVKAGFVNMGSSWSDGQSIILTSSLDPEAEVDRLEGIADYLYSGGGMTGDFSIKRE